MSVMKSHRNTIVLRWLLVLTEVKTYLAMIKQRYFFEFRLFHHLHIQFWVISSAVLQQANA